MTVSLGPLIAFCRQRSGCCGIRMCLFHETFWSGTLEWSVAKAKLWRRCSHQKGKDALIKAMLAGGILKLHGSGPPVLVVQNCKVGILDFCSVLENHWCSERNKECDPQHPCGWSGCSPWSRHIQLSNELWN